jgi:hypothetical protein
MKGREMEKLQFDSITTEQARDIVAWFEEHPVFREVILPIIKAKDDEINRQIYELAPQEGVSCKIAHLAGRIQGICDFLSIHDDAVFLLDNVE